MNLLIVFAISVAIIVALFATRWRRPAPAVTLDDIPAVLAALAASRADGNFAVFLFGAAGMPPLPQEGLNVQVSIDRGLSGIDWVLTSALNSAAEPRVASFFEVRARPAEKRSSNGVDYLRVEGEGLSELLQELLREEFAVTPSQRLDLIVEGFQWPARR